MATSKADNMRKKGVRNPRVLLVEDNEAFAESLMSAMSAEYEVVYANTPAKAMKYSLAPLEAAIVDVRLSEDDPNDTQGLYVLQSIKSRHPHLPVIIMTAYGDVDIAVTAMKLGAVDFIQKGRLDLQEFLVSIKAAVGLGQLEQKVDSLQTDLQRVYPSEIVGEHNSIRAVRNLISHVAADGEVSVLITGETGTGKELVARAIHREGSRSQGPFRAFCPASLNHTLVETELFGSEAGAFTDAVSRHGWLEMSHRGVLFLDEIGDLPADIQVRFLRFLEERKISRVGSTELVEVDAQIVAATNRDLPEMVSHGTFRADLFYRVKELTINLPPLRERKSDIPLLVHSFLESLRQQGRTTAMALDISALDRMQLYDWPGNIRELRSAVENAIVFAKIHGHSMPNEDDLPSDVCLGGNTGISRIRSQQEFTSINLRIELARYELSLITRALTVAGGKKGDAWILLGLNDRFALRRRIQAINRIFPGLLKEFPRLLGGRDGDIPKLD